VTTLYDGADAATLARRLSLPRVVLLDETTSTMDDAHALGAEGAPSGTLVLAESQTRGRGRSGGSWNAVRGSSILCTLIERVPASALDVLSLRVGLNVATALDPYAGMMLGLKWPNDIVAGGGKLAGILIETRWRDDVPEWVAIAIGLNVSAAPPGVAHSVSLTTSANRVDVLAAIVPALRTAAMQSGRLTPSEMDEWQKRDRLAGRRIATPSRGRVLGVLASGELWVETDRGPESVRAGTVTMEED
jgi:BirA family transcriptional regulator, biotin operon repressor / biotin---[acetyl-CoA-carboxylase] ligase